MGNTTISGIILHDGSNAIIYDNDCSKDSNITILPLYLLDADGTDVFDFGGVTKVITLSGVYIADSVANLKVWIDSIEALLQGHQDPEAGAPYDFVDDLRGSIKVKILNFSSPWTQGEPTRVGWSIKLVQSSTNA